MKGVVFPGDRMVSYLDVPDPTPGPLDVVVEIVSRDVPEPPLTEVGLRLAVMPAGAPVTDAARLTVLLKPFSGVTVMVLVPLLPGFMFTVSGEGERVKSGIVTGGVQFAIRKVAMRVCQLKAPSEGMFSVVYQNVQSSLGSIRSAV